MDAANIAEIFKSVQGEGISIGQPATFVRFWGCNLRCQFASDSCDTPYAVTAQFDKAKKFTAEQLARRIQAVAKGCNRVIFTGGEPLLSQPYILQVCKLLGKDYFFEVETNGTQELLPQISKVINQFNISPKLKSSNQVARVFEERRVICQQALTTYPPAKSSFKFVISSSKDLKEVQNIIARYNNIKVLLMPEGTTRSAVIKHSKAIIALCLKHNWRFGPREQIIVWGKKKGV